MSHRPKSLALTAGLLCSSIASLTGSTSADVYVETAYLPTSSILSTSLLPTSYVVPTAYFPTSYLPTSAVIASDPIVSATSTTYVRRSFFRPRRLIERTYTSYGLSPTTYLSTGSTLLPTSYSMASTPLFLTAYVTRSSLLPTSYLSSYSIAPTSYVIDNGVIATSATSSSYPCETTSTPAPRVTRSTAPRAMSEGINDSVITSVPSTGPSTNERRPQGMVSSTPASEEGMPSNVAPAPPKDPIPPPAVVPGARQETPPPSQPLDEPKPDSIKLPEPGRSGSLPPPQVNETSLLRSARRPSYDGRNILRGRVVSAESRRPEEGVTVVVSNMTKNYVDRPAMTDADGEFKVSLPDGDWLVKVTMPSGKVYSVGRDYVTAGNGRVVDASGRNVAEFLITR